VREPAPDPVGERLAACEARLSVFETMVVELSRTCASLAARLET